MNRILKKLFGPLLSVFESGEGPYNYKSSHRKILFAVGGLFLVLSLACAMVSVAVSQLGGLFPCAIFCLVGLTCIVVASLGSDRAVAKIWGSK